MMLILIYIYTYIFKQSHQQLKENGRCFKLENLWNRNDLTAKNFEFNLKENKKFLKLENSLNRNN